jgi:hypothetical protein
VLGLSLFIGQAFLYNAVFFTQALVLSTFFGVKDDVVPAYIIPFAFGNLLGAVLMIAAGIAEWFIGVEAAGKSLEDVAKPLTAQDEEAEATA